MPLTDIQIRNAKALDKSYRLHDTQGLYLEISPNGGKWWRLKYRINGKEKRLSLGVYPKVGLKTARESRDKMRKQLWDGTDPSLWRKLTKLKIDNLSSDVFERFDKVVLKLVDLEKEITDLKKAIKNRL